MRKIVIFTSLFFSYCTSIQGGRYFDSSVTKKISQLSIVEPPPAVISSGHVFATGIDDSIIESSFEKLYVVYKTLYLNTYHDFSDFLFDVVNQKIKLDAKNPKTSYYYSQVFMLDSSISEFYKKTGVEGLIKVYCVNNNNYNYYTLNRSALTIKEINSIGYFFFLNQFFRVDDDYHATINFKNLKSLIK